MSEEVLHTESDRPNPENDTDERETGVAAEFEEADIDEPPEKNGKRRRILKIGAAVVIVGIIAGAAYWLYARRFESTDDAFIDGDIVQISPKVSAYVSKVAVDSNQFVHKGDLLVELDPIRSAGRARTGKSRPRNGPQSARACACQCRSDGENGGRRPDRGTLECTDCTVECNADQPCRQCKAKPDQPGTCRGPNRAGKSCPNAGAGAAGGIELKACTRSNEIAGRNSSIAATSRGNRSIRR